jgi:hypothetical protein
MNPQLSKLVEMFSRWLNDDPEMVVVVASVKALTEVIKMSKGKVAF